MIRLNDIKESILQLVFPHVCDGCGSDLINKESQLCIHCLADLPETHYEKYPANPVEKMFYGRLHLEAASATYYFTKESLMQRLMHQLKYRGNKELGYQLGRLMGMALKDSGRFMELDALVPLPLFPQKEKKRGYNQSALLCYGIAEILSLPVLTDVISRPMHTETQTKKGRIDRWKNIEGKFQLTDPGALFNKYILLIDDVVTTGATLEACGQEILNTGNTRLSIATLCQSSR